MAEFPSMSDAVVDVKSALDGAERSPKGESPPSPARGRCGAFLELGKIRLSALNIFAVIAGCWIAYPVSAPPPWLITLPTALGTFLVAIGSSALNMYFERHLDPQMDRTKGRPLPEGRLTAGEVRLFGYANVAIGLTLLAVTTNWLATSLCAAIFVLYVFVYTPLKRMTSLNTLVGALPGALPVVVGYTAISGRINAPAIVLFLIVFFWQIPHFLAIAWRYREDYARSGMQMLPVVDPDGRSTTLQMLVYGSGLVVVSLTPYLIGMAGEIYLGSAVCLNLIFFVPTVFAAIRRTDEFMQLSFRLSLIYLPLLLLVMAIDERHGAPPAWAPAGWF